MFEKIIKKVSTAELKYILISSFLWRYEKCTYRLFLLYNLKPNQGIETLFPTQGAMIQHILHATIKRTFGHTTQLHNPLRWILQD